MRGGQGTFLMWAQRMTRYWAEHDGADLEELHPHLSGFVHSFLVLVGGYSGGGPPYSVAPRSRTRSDLDDTYVKEYLYTVGSQLGYFPARGSSVNVPPDTFTFLRLLWQIIISAPAGLGPHEQLIVLVADVAQMLENEYTFREVYVDDDGEITGLGPDIAPGLADAWQRLAGAPGPDREGPAALDAEVIR